MPKKNPQDAVLAELRSFGLRLPGAHTKSPWEGHLDLAVNDKTFAYLSVEGDPFKISCKLPQSGAVALMFEHTEPTPYGLGKSYWVTAKFPKDFVIPVDVLKSWIDESYRAQAPKKLVAQLGGEGAHIAASAPKKSPAKATKKSPAKATKKSAARPTKRAKAPA